MTHFTQQYFYPMTNVIQDYAWGSFTSIEALFDIKNTQNTPQAELWMGAHPNGCSTVIINGNSVLLSDLINQNQAAYLSSLTAEHFGELPYLFKVLAAEKALSIQVHPNKQQAIAGYCREENAGVALTAFNRNYKDNNHKPELVYALTPYQAMNGFREYQEILSLFNSMTLHTLQPFLLDFEQQPNAQGLSHFFKAILSLGGTQKDAALMELEGFAKAHQHNPLFNLINDLSVQYPHDIGLFTPLILNVITLQPGEAMYLNACTPHAYINGTGLEIMANSDNVLRAGLTPKFMDIDELMECTEFISTPIHSLIMKPTKINGGMNYPIPVSDFKFSVFSLVEDLPLETHSAEILFAIDADMTLNHSTGETVKVPKGHSVFIPAYAHQYTLKCHGKVARAYN